MALDQGRGSSAAAWITTLVVAAGFAATTAVLIKVENNTAKITTEMINLGDDINGLGGGDALITLGPKPSSGGN